jgi:hypothetical protein
MGENSVYSLDRNYKISNYPAYRGNRSNVSQNPPHAKSAQKSVRTG